MAKPIKINIVDSCGWRVCCNNNNNNNKARLQQINFAVCFVVVPLPPVAPVDIVVAVVVVVVARVALAVHQKQKISCCNIVNWIRPRNRNRIVAAVGVRARVLFVFICFIFPHERRESVIHSARARGCARVRAVERVREREYVRE